MSDDDNVVSFRGKTKLPIPVEKVLAGAIESHEKKPFSRVIIIGMYEDSDEEFFAASESDSAINSWDADRFKRYLHHVADLRVDASK
jgi:hypothetical protein